MTHIAATIGVFRSAEVRRSFTSTGQISYKHSDVARLGRITVSAVTIPGGPENNGG
jgi:hypothetical protein